jgi:hypothetical protein
VWSRDPSALLLAGVTVVLWGEFERPPKNLTGSEAAELVALAGGRALRLGDLSAIPASATLRGLAQAAAGAASGAMVQALSQSQAAMDDEGGERGGAERRSGGGGEGDEGEEEDPATVWTSLVAEAARVCAGWWSDSARLQSVIDRSVPVLDVSATTWRGMLLHWPEDDPACGPGRYSLTQLVLAASRSSPNVTRADFFVQLQTSDSTTAQPTNLVGTVVVRSVAIPLEPGFIVLPLSGLTPDTHALGSFLSVIVTR